jgi:hypothetical protein
MALVVLLSVGCSRGPIPIPSPPSPPSPPEDTASATVPTGAPTATIEAATPPTGRSFDIASITQVCEAWPESLPDRGIECDGGVRVALTSLGDSAASVTRIVFRYTPPCATGATCRRRPDRAWAWITSRTAGELLVALRVATDGGIAAAAAAPGKRLGLANPFEPPRTERREIPAPIPFEVRERDPMPLCGVETASSGDPLDRSARRCFLNSVLAGQGAEFITQGHGTEGEVFIEIDRFVGSGAVISYRRDFDRWTWSACGIRPVDMESVFELDGLCARGEFSAQQ